MSTSFNIHAYTITYQATAIVEAKSEEEAKAEFLDSVRDNGIVIIKPEDLNITKVEVSIMNVARDATEEEREALKKK